MMERTQDETTAVALHSPANELLAGQSCILVKDNHEHVHVPVNCIVSLELK